MTRKKLAKLQILFAAWMMSQAIVGWGQQATEQKKSTEASAWVTSDPPYQAENMIDWELMQYMFADNAIVVAQNVSTKSSTTMTSKEYDRVILGNATWPGNAFKFNNMGEYACSKLRGEDGKGWRYESECRVSKILRMPKLGELKHICNDDYEYIPNGKLGQDKFVVLVENTDGRKAIVTMMIEVYEETGQIHMPNFSGYSIADYSYLPLSFRDLTGAAVGETVASVGRINEV